MQAETRNQLMSPICITIFKMKRNSKHALSVTLALLVAQVRGQRGRLQAEFGGKYSGKYSVSFHVGKCFYVGWCSCSHILGFWSKIHFQNCAAASL